MVDDTSPTKAAAASPPLALRGRLPGTCYAPLECLGEGASGEVLLARHVELDALVVVKLLHFTLDDAPDLAERMRLEAQTLARLSHPHIVRVLDYGVSDGRPYFAMEHLGGEPLDEVLFARGAFSLEHALELARQLLDALGYLHDKGLVHRDIKPQNLLLCSGPDGAPLLKLIDFGVLKLGDASGTIAPIAFPTETGTSIGTPRYLAPEQARGQKVDGRSDLYAAGLVLYELLAGRAAFAHHEDIASLLMAQIREMPEPLSSFTGVPDAVDRVIQRAVAKAPEDRFATAAAFWAALESAAGAPPTTRLPSSVSALETEVLEASTRRLTPPAATWAATEIAPASLPSPPPPTPAPRPRARALATFLATAAAFFAATVLALVALRVAGVLP
jgi:eukaryotic-like serine/threonine-protein kinase